MVKEWEISGFLFAKGLRDSEKVIVQCTSKYTDIQYVHAYINNMQLSY